MAAPCTRLAVLMKGVHHLVSCRSLWTVPVCRLRTAWPLCKAAHCRPLHRSFGPTLSSSAAGTTTTEQRQQTRIEPQKTTTDTQNDVRKAKEEEEEEYDEGPEYIPKRKGKNPMWKIGYAWMIGLPSGIIGFLLAKRQVDKNRLQQLKIRQRIKQSNEGEYESSRYHRHRSQSTEPKLDQ